jgi:uncharacterized membrane protein
MESKNGSAILTLSTDKKSRPICSVADIEVSKKKGSEGWLHITLSTGTQIHFSREATEAIRTKLTTGARREEQRWVNSVPFIG